MLTKRAPVGAVAMNTVASRNSYTISRTVDLGHDEAIEAVTAALKEEGFGVLTTIDVQATLRNKIGAEVEPYVILGACNPHLAHRALGEEDELGALLPCNVVVYRRGDTTHVAAMDPNAALGVVGNDAIVPVADEATERITQALESL